MFWFNIYLKYLYDYIPLIFLITIRKKQSSKIILYFRKKQNNIDIININNIKLL